MEDTSWIFQIIMEVEQFLSALSPKVSKVSEVSECVTARKNKIYNSCSMYNSYIRQFLLITLILFLQVSRTHPSIFWSTAVMGKARSRGNHPTLVMNISIPLSSFLLIMSISLTELTSLQKISNKRFTKQEFTIFSTVLTTF